MNDQADFFEEDIPSRHVELLSQMKGRTIEQLRKLAWQEPERECQERNLEFHRAFIMSCGTVVLDLDNGLQVGFFYRLRPPSVTVTGFQKSSGERLEGDNFEENPKAYFIDCNDPVYSDQKYAKFIGKKIKQVKMLKGDKTSAFTWVSAFEAGVALTMEDDTELMIACFLVKEQPETNPLTRDMLTPEVLKTLEKIEV